MLALSIQHVRLHWVELGVDYPPCESPEVVHVWPEWKERVPFQVEVETKPLTRVTFYWNENFVDVVFVSLVANLEVLLPCVQHQEVDEGLFCWNVSSVFSCCVSCSKIITIRHFKSRKQTW